MKVIFLDFDGVITIPPKWHINSDKLKYIKRIVDETGAKIVISSSWRRGIPPSLELTIEKMIGRPKRCPRNKMMNWFVDNLYDVTPIYSSPRGNEIKGYLDKHPEVDNYVILDDDGDMLDEQLFHFVQTNYEDGITEVEGIRAIKVLNRNFFQNPMALNFTLRNEWVNKCKGLPNRQEELWKYNDLEKDFHNRYGED